MSSGRGVVGPPVPKHQPKQHYNMHHQHNQQQARLQRRRWQIPSSNIPTNSCLKREEFHFGYGYKVNREKTG